MELPINEKEIQAAKAAGIRFYSSPEEKERAYLMEGLARTDKERFLFLMNLMKLERIMRKAKFQSK